MEKLGQLAATDKWDLIVVDTPPSRSALDFLDAPQRLSTFLDGRMIRLLSAPARAGGRSLRKVRRGRASRCSPRRCRRSSAARCSPTRRRSCRRSTRCSAASGNGPPPPTSCCARRAPRSSWSPRRSRTRCARRPTSSTGSRTEDMPLAGLVLNRTHPVLAPLSATPGPRRRGRAARRPARRRRAAPARRPGRPRRTGGPAARPVLPRAPRRCR